MRVSAVFFCGHKSPYGMAHIEPLIEHFNVLAVVVADEARWEAFKLALNGYKYDFTRARHALIKRMITAASRCRYSYQSRQNSNTAKLRNICSKSGVKVIFVNDVNGCEMLSTLSALSPEVLFSAAYPQIFKKQLLQIPARGAVNYHPSLLPRYRGAHPHFWTVVKGDKIGGVTAHFMTERIDDGDIIAQKTFHIDEMYYSDIYKKIISITPELVRSVRLFLDDRNSVAVKQDETLVTVFRNNREIHSRIFWRIYNCVDIYNLIRTETAYCFIGDKRVRITKGAITNSNRNMTNNALVDPGTVVDINDEGIVVATLTKDNYIVVKTLQYGQCDEVPHDEFLAGNMLSIGLVLQ